MTRRTSTPSATAPNVVVAVRVPSGAGHDYTPFFLKTWQAWCHLRGATLCLLEAPPATAVWASWYKYLVFDALDRAGIAFRKVAIVDLDTMVHWDCPDFFALCKGRELGAVVDADNLGWIHSSLARYQPLFPGTSVDWCEYVNGGFVVLDRVHRELYRRMLAFGCSAMPDAPEGARFVQATEQTPLNYMIRAMNLRVRRLPKRFNLTHLAMHRCLLDGSFVHLGWIWHFNGLPPDVREQAMRATWHAVARNYPKSRRPRPVILRAGRL